MKKGVDKGRGVWYISKALGARDTAEAGRPRNFRGNRKKVLTNLRRRGKMKKFAARAWMTAQGSGSEEILKKMKKGLDKRETVC